MKFITCLMLALTVLCICVAAIASSSEVDTCLENEEETVYIRPDIREIIENGPYAEPEGVTVPNGVEWNSELGEYYRADSFVWNSDTKSYSARQSEAKVEIDASLDYDWHERYADDDDPITTALIKFDELYDAFYKEDYTRSLSSVPLYCDEAWDALRGLGKESLNDIIDRIIEDPQRASILMTAVEEITGVEVSVVKQYQNTDLWIEAFADKIASKNEYSSLHEHLLTVTAE